VESSINVEFDWQKQQTYCLGLHFLDFSIANLFMRLVVSISHGRSCSLLLTIRLFSLFYLKVVLCSFYHLQF